MFTYRVATVDNYNEKQNRKQKIKVPLSLIIFFILNLLFGVNLGYTRCLKKEIRPIFHLLQFIIAFLITIPLSIPINTLGCFFMMTASQHIFSVFLFHCSKYNIYDLIIDINGIDKEIMRPVEKKMGLIMTVAYFGFFLIKASICVGYCGYASGDNCVYNILPGSLSCILALAPDGIPIVQVLIYYYIFRSVKYLKESVKEMSMEMQVFIRQYIAVADCYDRIMPMYGKLVVGELAVTIPRLMYMFWHLIKSMKQPLGAGIYIGQGVFITHVVMKFCAPSIIAEMTHSQVRDLKITLRNRIIEEKDEDKKLEVCHMLEYMESRHFHYTVCRVIPVDLQLIVSMFGFCTTYFIVIVQFTHLL